MVRIDSEGHMTYLGYETWSGRKAIWIETMVPSSTPSADPCAFPDLRGHLLKESNRNFELMQFEIYGTAGYMVVYDVEKVEFFYYSNLNLKTMDWKANGGIPNMKFVFAAQSDFSYIQ